MGRSLTRRDAASTVARFKTRPPLSTYFLDLFSLIPLFALASAHASPVATSAISARAYVQPGIVAQWDAIENAGYGLHGDVATDGWTDLAGGCVLTTNVTTGGSVTTLDNAIVLTNASLRAYDSGGAATAIGNAIGAAKKTVEIAGQAEIYLKYQMWFCVEKSSSDVEANRIMLWYEERGNLLDEFCLFSKCYNSATYNYGLTTKTPFTVSAAFSAANVINRYANGSLVATSTHSGSPAATTTSSAGIGLHAISYAAGPNRVSNTVYRAVRVYNRALSATEVEWNAMLDQHRFLDAALDESKEYGGRRVVDGAVQVRLLAEAGTGGSVSLTHGGTSIPVGTTTWVAHDPTKAVVFRATPEAGKSFFCWTGETEGFTAAQLRSPELLFVADSPRSLKAWFRATTSVTSYIKKGLVGHWDGEFNSTNAQGVACHDSTPGVKWLDLSGQGQHAWASKVNGVNPRWGENYMNPSNTENGVTSLQPCYSFTPSDACRAAANCDNGGLTFSVCAKVNVIYGDMTIFSFTGGGAWYTRCDYRCGGSPGFVKVRGAGEYDISPSCSAWAKNCVDTVAWGRGILSRHFWNADYADVIYTRTASLGARQTGNGNMGARGYGWNGDFNLHNVRVYDRELNRVEAAYNAEIDRTRFFGTTPRITVNVGTYSSTNANYATVSPAYDSLTAVTPGTAKTFSVTGVAAHPFDQKPAYVASATAATRALYHGFTLTTIDSAGVETETAYGETDTSASATIENDTFMTVNWETQYRVIALAGKGGKILVAGTDEAVAGYTNWHNAFPRTSVTVTAVPDANFAFSGWEGDVTGDPSEAETTITMNQGRTISCTFVRGGKGDGSTYCWTGSSSTTWNDGDNWDRGYPPLEGDCAVLTSSVAQTVLVNAATPRLKSLVVGGGPKATTVKMQNWETQIEADEIVVTNNGILTCVGPFNDSEMSNRVNLVCGDFTLYAGGKIDVNAVGYGWTTGASDWGTPGCGPGKGASAGCGAAHGGRGGRGEPASFAGTYDSKTAPLFAGSSAGGNCYQRGGRGGGAVRIDATGAVRLWGPVTANGVQSENSYAGSGAGGSVYVTCQTFDGTNVISALGGTSYGYESGGGGGGRIAIVYDAAAQAAANLNPTPFLQAGCDRRGCAYVVPSQYPSVLLRESRYCMRGEPGTVYLADGSFYPGKIWTECSGYVTAADATDPSVTLDSLTFKAESVNNNYNGRRPILRNATVNIPGDVRIEGGTALVFSDCTVNVGSLIVTNGYFELLGNSTLTVAGDLIVAGSGTATFASGSTNGVDAATWSEFGQRIAVGGSLVVKDKATLYVQSDKLRGGSPYVELGRDLVVGANAKVSGYARGWGRDELTWTGRGGPGNRTDIYCGGAYGGTGGGGGGRNSKTYGDARNPTDPGSSGGTALWAGGWGGGLLRVSVQRDVTLNGKITMDGGYSLGGNLHGGGSGGGVNIRCRVLRGSGSITAKGGTAGTGGSAKTEAGCGGGGRIYVHCRCARNWTGTVSAAAGTNNFVYAYAAGDGTAIVKPAGGLILLVR